MEYRAYGTYLTWSVEDLLKKNEEHLSVKDIVERLFGDRIDESERFNCMQRVKRSLEYHLQGRVEVEERRGKGNLIIKYYKIKTESNGETQST